MESSVVYNYLVPYFYGKHITNHSEGNANIN